MIRFAANLSTLYQDLPFLDRIDAAAADGFDAVECQLPYGQSAQALAARLKTAKLPLVLFNAPPGGTEPAAAMHAWEQGMRGVAALPGREAEFRAGFELALTYARTLACPRLHVMAGVPAADTPARQEQARQTFLDNLRWAARRAQAQDTTVLIEPINGRDMPGYLLQRQAEAHAILDAVNEPNLLLQLDLYHCQITEGDLSTHLTRAFSRQRLGHIQIAGVPTRHEPDEGEVHYPHLLSLIAQLQSRHTRPGQRSNWSGHIGCEYRPARGDGPGSTRAGLQWLNNWRQGHNGSPVDHGSGPRPALR